MQYIYANRQRKAGGLLLRNGMGKCASTTILYKVVSPSPKPFRRHSLCVVYSGRGSCHSLVVILSASESVDDVEWVCRSHHFPIVLESHVFEVTPGWSVSRVPVCGHSVDVHIDVVFVYYLPEDPGQAVDVC